jgi:hypothetical protein
VERLRHGGEGIAVALLRGLLGAPLGDLIGPLPSGIDVVCGPLTSLLEGRGGIVSQNYAPSPRCTAMTDPKLHYEGGPVLVARIDAEPS